MLRLTGRTGWIVLLGSLFTLLWGLGSYPLLQPDEGRNAEVAREMLESGNWLVPTYNGLPYLDKPAFFFKAVALSMGLFGQNEAAARLPSALFGLATLGLFYAFCRRFYDGRTAAAAVAVIATSLLFVGFARYVIFDMTLGFFVSAAILACYCAAEGSGPERARFYTLAALCAGFATIVKGPVGFMLPTLVIAAHQAWGGDRGWWRDAFRPRNLMVFWALVLVWFIGLSLHHPDFPYYGLVKESFQRFTSNEFRRSQPFYFYALVLGIGLFPWSLLLPEGVAAAWRERRSWPRTDRLFAVWAVVVVVFFSLSQSKLPGYILTAVSALGVLSARLFVQSLDAPDGDRRRRIILHGALALGVTAAAASVICALPRLAPASLDAVPARTAVYLRDLSGGFTGLAVLFAVTAGLALLAAARRSIGMAGMAFLGFPLLLVPILVGHMETYAGHRSAAGLAQRMPALDAETLVACFRCYPNGFSFYSHRLVTVISANDGYEMQSNYIRFTLRDRAEWPDGMVREQDFERWLDQRGVPVYLLVRTSDIAALPTAMAGQSLRFTALTPAYSGTLLAPRRPQPSNPHPP